MQYQWTVDVLNDGYMRSPYGMKFYWPGTKQGRSGYIDNTTSIFNFSIQGFATAEIIPIGLVCFWHRIKGTRITLWNTIHDSLASRLHRDDVELYEQLSVRAMTRDVYDFLEEVYGYTFDFVPLGVGVKVSKFWGQAPVEKLWTVSKDGEVQYTEK